MPSNFQFGFEHYLYLGVTTTTTGTAPNQVTTYTPRALNARPVASPAAGDVSYNTADLWTEYANVRTVNVGGNANSVDITTRDEARSGFSTEVDVTTTGEMTFEVRYKPTSSTGAVQDPVFEALLRAWLGKYEIAGVDLDKKIDQPGAQGLVGNWTVSFSNQKEVQGVVLASLTLKLSSYPNWIRRNSAGTSFTAIS